MSDTIPDSKVQDTQENFENDSQLNSAESIEAQGMRNLNRKRTYDTYQDLDLQTARSAKVQADQIHNVGLQALQNAVETANMVSKQAIKHADVAADALWTDELNPVTRGAANDLTGQAPVNAGLASTASLDTVFGNLTAQYGELAVQVVGLAQSVMESNSKLADALSKVIKA